MKNRAWKVAATSPLSLRWSPIGITLALGLTLASVPLSVGSACKTRPSQLNMADVVLAAYQGISSWAALQRSRRHFVLETQLTSLTEGQATFKTL